MGAGWNELPRVIGSFAHESSNASSALVAGLTVIICDQASGPRMAFGVAPRAGMVWTMASTYQRPAVVLPWSVRAQEPATRPAR